MQSRSRLIQIGVLTFVVGAILFFPARVAYQWFAPAGLSLSGISGSIWNGRAREGDANGVYLRDLQWHIRPLDFATLKLGFAVNTVLASGFIEGDIAFGVTGSIIARNISASLPLATLQAVIGMPGLQGNISAQFSVLKLEDGLLVTADGVLEVADLIAPLIDRNSIGGYKAEFLTQESGVFASVEDTDGVVDLAGSLQISTDRSYVFIAQISAKPETPPNLRQQMQFLGSVNDRGQHELRIEGQL